MRQMQAQTHFTGYVCLTIHRVPQQPRFVKRSSVLTFLVLYAALISRKVIVSTPRMTGWWSR